MGFSRQEYWSSLPIPSQWTLVTVSVKLKDTCSLEEKLWQTLQCIKKWRHHFSDKGPYSQSYVFSSIYVRMWELVHKEGWVPKNWCFWIVVLEKTRESLLDCKEIKPVNPKGNQPWIFIGRTDAKVKLQYFADTDSKSWLAGKDPDSGKDWGQEEKGVVEHEMVRWHHLLNGVEFEQTPEDSEGQGSLAHCSTWGCKESDNLVTEQQLKHYNTSVNKHKYMNVRVQSKKFTHINYLIF